MTQDGGLSDKERTRLLRICERLKISENQAIREACLWWISNKETQLRNEWHGPL